MDTNEKLTAANIRYLLTMKAFADADRPIRITYLAEHLHFKKSSVHSMLQILSALGMIEKGAGSVISLTEKGAAAALQYQTYYSALDAVMQRCFPAFGNRENAVLALLAEIPEQDLRRFAHQE